MVSGAYDQGKTYDAGGYQAYRPSDRAGRCAGAAQQQKPGYRRTGKK